MRTRTRTKARIRIRTRIKARVRATTTTSEVSVLFSTLFRQEQKWRGGGVYYRQAKGVYITATKKGYICSRHETGGRFTWGLDSSNARDAAL